ERPTDLVIAPAERILANLRSAGTALLDGRGRKRDEVENVAAIQRNLVSLAFVDDLTKGRRVWLQQRRLTAHFYCLGNITYLHSQIYAGSLLHLHHPACLGGGLEPGLL